MTQTYHNFVSHATTFGLARQGNPIVYRAQAAYMRSE